MRQVLSHIDERSRRYAERPLFAFMRDENISPEQRLAIAPGSAHFVMTFADLYTLVLREEPAREEYQKLVNAHTYEDGGHFKWFLSDLAKLGQDVEIKFSDALRFLWGDATVAARRLAHEVCRLGLGASSLQKLVLVLCIEATGKVSLTEVSKAGRAYFEKTGRKLVYLGAHHVATEADHTLEGDDAQRALQDVALSDAERSELLTVVDRIFDCFCELSDEVLRYAQSHPQGLARLDVSPAIGPSAHGRMP